MPADERLQTLKTPRDWFRYAVSRFQAAGLVFGHGDDQCRRRSRLHRARRLASADRRARSLRRRKAAARRTPAARRTDRRARLDAQARRLPAEPRLYPGRAVLCRRTRHRAAQFHWRAVVLRARRRRRPHRRPRRRDLRARPLHGRRIAGDPRRARVSERGASTRRTFPPTRSRSPRETSPSTGSTIASGLSRATCSRGWVRRATTSSSPTRPMSKRRGGRVSQGIRRRAETRPCRRRRMGSTSCGASSPRRARI